MPSEIENDTNLPAIAALPRDMALMKLENDTIQSMALARPRDYAKVKQDVADQLTAFPSFARAAIYRKPVGIDPKTGQQKYAYGLSVRAAEAICAAYGYNRVRTATDPVDGSDDVVRITATFTDFQSGRIWEDSSLKSKFYTTSKSKGSKRARIDDDRFDNVVVKAAKSIHVREVILRSVAPGLRTELYEMAEAAVGALMTDAEVDKLLKAFAKLEVTQEMIEAHLGHKRAFWSQRDRIDMQATYVAIRDNDTTVDAVFNPEQPEAPAGEASGSLEELADRITGQNAANAAPSPKEPEAPVDMNAWNDMLIAFDEKIAVAETDAAVNTALTIVKEQHASMPLSVVAELEERMKVRKAEIREAKKAAKNPSQQKLMDTNDNTP